MRFFAERDYTTSTAPCIKYEPTDTAIQTLLPLALIDSAGNFDPTQPAHIFGNPLVEGLGNFLPVFGRPQLAFIRRVTNERYLRENRRHVGADQHDEWRFLNTAIADARGLRR